MHSQATSICPMTLIKECLSITLLYALCVLHQEPQTCSSGRHLYMCPSDSSDSPHIYPPDDTWRRIGQDYTARVLEKNSSTLLTSKLICKWSVCMTSISHSFNVNMYVISNVINVVSCWSYALYLQNMHTLTYLIMSLYTLTAYYDITYYSRLSSYNNTY